MTEHLTVGFSPCPNDTYIFQGLATNRVSAPGYAFRFVIADVESLNALAMDRALDVSKMSFHAWLKVREHYRLLDVGGALGHGCGPILVALGSLETADRAGCRVAFPGRWTTAHLLFRLWAAAEFTPVFTTYDRVLSMIRSGEADCGVIIHENRFTYRREGFSRIVDLGEWWETETGLPVPLGCIAAKRTLGPETHGAVESAIRESLGFADADPAACLPFMRRHAMEMEESVLWQHVATFVNGYTRDLGETGRAAVDRLIHMAQERGIAP